MYVYDINGKPLGTLTSVFGSSLSFGSSDLYLKVGKTVTKETSIDEYAYESDDLSDFFVALFNSDLSDLEFESWVEHGTYYE